jgi:hypothetical protein
MSFTSFYAKNEKMITLVLLIIAIILAIFVYRKYKENKDLQKSLTQQDEKQQDEKYRFIGASTGYGMGKSLNLSGELSNIRNAGMFSRDTAAKDVYKGIQNIGKSGYVPGDVESVGLDPSGFTAYGGKTVGYY